MPRSQAIDIKLVNTNLATSDAVYAVYRAQGDAVSNREFDDARFKLHGKFIDISDKDSNPAGAQDYDTSTVFKRYKPDKNNVHNRNTAWFDCNFAMGQGATQATYADPDNTAGVLNKDKTQKVGDDFNIRIGLPDYPCKNKILLLRIGLAPPNSTDANNRVYFDTIQVRPRPNLQNSAVV